MPGLNINNAVDLALLIFIRLFEAHSKVIYNEGVYAQQFCFVKEINLLLETQLSNYTALNKKEIAAKTVEVTVINTSNFPYYFSKK